MTKKIFFPIWQIDRQEYEAICVYLEISSKEHLFEKLSDYLARAPFLFTRPKNFLLFLTKPRLTRFRIARLDLLSKLFFQNHPIRYILNGVIALYECDGEGYTEISTVPEGWKILISLAGWGGGFGVSLIISPLWLCWQYMIYLISFPFRHKDDLTGKRVLITGVSRGLGLDLLLYSLQQGAEVIGTVRNQESSVELLAQLPKEAPVKLLVVDLFQDKALIKALQNTHISSDSIDIAVLCAGIKYSDTSVLSLSNLRNTFEVNFFSSIELANWLCSSDHKKALVFISSIGRWHGMHLSGGYNASKAALSIWGESLEMELYNSGQQNCNVMIVEPGIFESGMMRETAISKFFFTSRNELATQIIFGALTGKKVLRYPFWFALLTWTMCLGGRSFRNHLFANTSKSIRKVN